MSDLDVSAPVPDPPRPPAGGRLERLSPLLAEVGLDPRRLLVGGVALALVVAVGAALFWPRPAESTAPELALPQASTTLGGTGTATTVATDLLVHVAGHVARPGVYRLPPGARVDDAVTAAGGLATTADAARVNLAAPVADGERIFVPAVGEPVPEVAVGATSAGPNQVSGSGVASGPGAGPAVDVNTASLAELDTLPGVGPATAQAIIDHRTQHGPFTSVDELLDVRGIGDAKLAELRDRVSV